MVQRVEREIAVVVLHRLLLELAATFGIERNGFTARVLLSSQVVVHQRGVSVRPRAVRTTVDVHLEEPQIEAKLNPQFPVAALNPARADAGRIVIPVP